MTVKPTKASIRRLAAVTRVLEGVTWDERDVRKVDWIAEHWDDDTTDWFVDLLLRVRETGHQTGVDQSIFGDPHEK